jgi:hypothetical protein
MLPRLNRSVLFLAAIAACFLPSSARAGNLIQNGGFDTPMSGLTPPNYPTSISGAGASGPSSAESWTLFNNFDATTSTELLPTTDPTGSLPYMIHLTSVTNTSDPNGSFFNGLQQGFATQSTLTTASVDVDVLSGPVILALYAGDGSTLINFVISTTTNQWSTLSVSAAAGTDPNLVILYSYSTTGTGEFYADNASVTAASVPEPASGVLALFGMSALALWLRKARPRLGSRRVRPST